MQKLFGIFRQLVLLLNVGQGKGVDRVWYSVLGGRPVFVSTAVRNGEHLATSSLVQNVKESITAVSQWAFVASRVGASGSGETLLLSVLRLQYSPLGREREREMSEREERKEDKPPANAWPHIHRAGLNCCCFYLPM